MLFDQREGRAWRSVTVHNDSHPALPFLSGLRIEIIDGGLLGLGGAEVLDVTHNTDDGHPVGRLGAGPIHAGADRILRREEGLGERAVNDGHVQAAGVVSGVEIAACEQRDAHQAEVVASDAAGLYFRLSANGKSATFDHGVVCKPITGHGQLADQCGV